MIKPHKPEQKIKASSVESSSLLYMHRLMILHHKILRNKKRAFLLLHFQRAKSENEIQLDWRNSDKVGI